MTDRPPPGLILPEKGIPEPPVATPSEEARWTIYACDVCHQEHHAQYSGLKCLRVGRDCEGQVVPYEVIPASRIEELEGKLDWWAGQYAKDVRRLRIKGERMREALERIASISPTTEALARVVLSPPDTEEEE